MLRGACIKCKTKFKIGDKKWIHRDVTKLDDTGRTGDFATQAEELCPTCHASSPRGLASQEEFLTTQKKGQSGTW